MTAGPADGGDGATPSPLGDELRYVSVPQIAEALDVSHDTVRALIHSGELPAIKPGKAWRVRLDVVRAFLLMLETKQAEALAAADEADAKAKEQVSQMRHILGHPGGRPKRRRIPGAAR